MPIASRTGPSAFASFVIATATALRFAPAPSRPVAGRPSPGGASGAAGKPLAFAGFDPQGCVAFLRARHPTKTARAVEAATGVPWRTVERWLAEGSSPSLPAWTRCAVAYGPAFVAASLPDVAWVERAAAIATEDGLAHEIAELEARRGKLLDGLLRFARRGEPA